MSTKQKISRKAKNSTSASKKDHRKGKLATEAEKAKARDCLADLKSALMLLMPMNNSVNVERNARQRERIASDNEYRERINAFARERRGLRRKYEDGYRERINAIARDRRASDSEYREKINARARERYARGVLAKTSRA